jgi:hypothetical protein
MNEPQSDTALPVRSDATAVPSELVPSSGRRRDDFLLEMYRQTSMHLGRHVTGVWQCVGVVGAAFVTLALDRDKPLNDYACALVILLCAWLIATTLDASNWFNRNIAIIRNIERLFLLPRDAKLVHPYFMMNHREPGKPAEHFRIQLALGIAVAALVLVYHFSVRVWAGRQLPLSSFDPPRVLPYIVTVGAIAVCIRFQHLLRQKDRDFKQQAPGLEPTAKQ